MDKGTSKKSSFLSPVPPALLLDYSAGRVVIELWWTNQEFFRADVNTDLRAHISRGDE
jgi:hypothetical protein